MEVFGRATHGKLSLLKQHMGHLTQKSILYFSSDPTEGLFRFEINTAKNHIIWPAFTYIAYNGDCTPWEKRGKDFGTRNHR